MDNAFRAARGIQVSPHNQALCVHLPTLVPSVTSVSLTSTPNPAVTTTALALRPPQPETDAHFTPFPLPRFPFSQLMWMATLSGRLWQAEKRCLALTLMLDFRTGFWIAPCLPRQWGGSEGVHWKLFLEDYQGLPPTWRVGGTFQYLRDLTRDSAIYNTPPIDGLHLLTSDWDRATEEVATYIAIRSQGQLRLIDPKTMLYDDWMEYIAIHRERLQDCPV